MTKAPATKTASSTAAATRGNSRTSKATAGDLVVRVDEDPWTEAELAELREELTAEIERHEAHARTVRADLADLLVSGEGGGGDAADVGTSNFERDQELALAAYASEAINQTRLALQKMAQGTYGQCDNCGQPIGKGRLQVYPRATLCMTCKEREERR
ncbi:TraR/DksA family transcriptional regulator [Propionibacteriaceae bacterium Y2011]|uniref:TraR/DksA family transcriptional regulator n=1 Tax=Microlunatus sp. Y2014 TaxID=3418488 RepID=UPI003B492509